MCKLSVNTHTHSVTVFIRRQELEQKRVTHKIQQLQKAMGINRWI